MGFAATDGPCHSGGKFPHHGIGHNDSGGTDDYIHFTACANNGIFNIGTGTGRSWNEVAASLFHAVGRPLNIEYIHMPVKLKEKYQNYTCADMTKLQSAGCSHTCMDIDTAIKEYARDYLDSN